MKVKYIFEESDFDAAGQMIIRNNYQSITTAYKVGYGYEKEGGQFYCLISLADGMICSKADSLKELAEKINQDSEGYRPMTKEEIVDLVGGHENRFV